MRKHHKKWNVVQSGYRTVVLLHLATGRHRTLTPPRYLVLSLHVLFPILPDVTWSAVTTQRHDLSNPTVNHARQ